MKRVLQQVTDAHGNGFCREGRSIPHGGIGFYALSFQPTESLPPIPNLIIDVPIEFGIPQKLEHLMIRVGGFIVGGDNLTSLQG